MDFRLGKEQTGFLGRDLNNTRLITVTAVLTAMGIIIPSIMPKFGVPPVLTVTPLSHLPLMLAVFIHPLAALFTYFATTLAFFLTATPFVGLRAASHILFVLHSLYIYSKGRGLKGWGAYAHAAILSAIHALSEALMALVATLIGIDFNGERVSFWFIVVSFLAFFAHSMFDWFFAFNIRKLFIRLKLFN